MTMNKDSAFATLPELPFAALQRSGAFAARGELARVLRPGPAVPPGPGPELLFAPIEQIITEVTWLYVLYPKVTCHPVFEDLVADFDLLTTAMRAPAPSPVQQAASDAVADGLYAVRDGSLLASRFPMVCTVFSGPWSAIYTHKLDSCGRQGYLESHRIEVFDFPELTVEWFGLREDMPQVPGLTVVWGTGTGAQSTTSPCGGGNNPGGGGDPGGGVIT